MDNPFQNEMPPSPFQGGFQPPPGETSPRDAHAGSQSGVRMFKAVDLAPMRAEPGPAAPLGPGVSPFLENFQSPFAPAPKEDFSPVPQKPAPAAAAPASFPPPQPPAVNPAAARASQIVAASEFPMGAASTYKPRFFLTTTAAFEGYPIDSYLGVVSVEIVIPKDILFRNPAPYGELHRLKSAEDQLQKVKEKAMEELSERARALQADGVLGVRLDFSALDAVACLCSVSGTAVKLAT